MKRHLWLPSFLIIGLVVTPAAFANAAAEREALAEVIHELNVLESLIKRAEANAEQDSRIRFRYDWLRQDLKQIKDGIQSHIDFHVAGDLSGRCIKTHRCNWLRYIHHAFIDDRHRCSNNAVPAHWYILLLLHDYD